MSDMEFETFWNAYPNKIGKGDARRKFMRALARGISLATMLSAIEKYKKYKPEWRDFCMPATWLHQERWADEWEQERSEVDETKFRRPTPEEAKAYRAAHPYLTRDPKWIPIDWNVQPLRAVK